MGTYHHHHHLIHTTPPHHFFLSPSFSIGHGTAQTKHDTLSFEFSALSPLPLLACANDVVYHLLLIYTTHHLSPVPSFTVGCGTAKTK